MVTVTREPRRLYARPCTEWHPAAAWTRSVPSLAGVLRVQGVLDGDQEGEGDALDMLDRAGLRWFHLDHVRVASGGRHCHAIMHRGRERGSVRCGEVRGVC